VSLRRRDLLAGLLTLGAAAPLGCKDTAMTPSNLAASTMPVLFLAHGAPPLLDDAGWIGELAAWSQALPRPRAIAVVSAHWEARPVTIGAVRPLPLIYDFYGFPDRFYRLQYPAPGAPELARRIQDLLAAARIPCAEDAERGLDHGSYIPLIDYTMPKQVDSQYNSNRVIATYDGLSDFPDRPDNLWADANAFAAAAIVHTPAAFTGPGDVPPQNMKTTVNSKGATTTTYLIPVNHLPLTLPLRYLGFSPGFVDQIDAVLQPQIDAGYSRYDNPLNRPTSVDPAHGMDPIGSLDPATRNSIEDTFNTVRSFMPPLP